MDVTYHFEFFVSGFEFCSHPLHIVVYPVQHRPLIDDHGLQLAEDIRQLDDALCDVVDFSLPLQDDGVVASHEPLGGLLEGRLRERPVRVRLHQRRIGVRIRGWGCAALEWGCHPFELPELCMPVSRIYFERKRGAAYSSDKCSASS